MPGLTIATDSVPPPTAPTTATNTSTSANPPASTNPHSSRSSSPSRPPVSPITPTFAPARLATSSRGVAPAAANPPPPPPSIPSFAQGRPTFTHSQPDQVAIAPPRPAPIDFDDNPDVLALKSAISILQLQRAKAERDIRQLQGAKTEALESPDVFVRDLAGGKVRTQGDPLFGSLDDDDDDDDDDEEEDDKESNSKAPEGSMSVNSSPSQSKSKTAPKPAWASLPNPQNVVRCPPINWAQYAVVGESLDKLHADQVRRPSEGVPATVGPGGTFEFKGEGVSTGQKTLVGIAAPYVPGRDKLDKKPKGKK